MALLFFSLAASGCKPATPLIDHVSVKSAPNLESIKISLFFSNTIKSELAGGFMVKDYGFLFVNPYTPSEPFELGFSLNIGLFKDPEYISLRPTTVLPNGIALGLEYPLVEVKNTHPASSKFDLYAYVDISHSAWLGTAAIFEFINDQYFPNGLSVSQTFMPDAQGRPSVIASVFGPTTQADGTMKRAGGITVLANVKQLFTHPNEAEFILYPHSKMVIEGPNAEVYQGNPRKLLRLQNRLIRGLNQEGDLILH